MKRSPRAKEAHRWLFWRRRRGVVGDPPAPSASVEDPPPVLELEVEIAEVIVTKAAVTGPAVTKRTLDLSGLEEPEPTPPSEAPSPKEPTVPPPRTSVPPPTAPVDQPPVSPPPRPPAREWNLWELERLAREHAGTAPLDEEWSALFVYLRQFASAEGSLPKEFDDLVRESFAELIQPA